MRAAQISRGVVNIAAKAVLLILTCLACIAIGFFLPMAPVLRNFIGSAVYAGSLATAGAIAGMYVADAILARLEPPEFDARAPGAKAKLTKKHDGMADERGLKRASRSISSGALQVTRPGGAPAW